MRGGVALGAAPHERLRTMTKPTDTQSRASRNGSIVLIGSLADIHIAAVLLEHGVRDIVTSDSDLRRFPGLRVHSLAD